MQYAVWIALAVVFIAIAPALFKRGDGGSDGSPGDGGGGDGSDGGDD